MFTYLSSLRKKKRLLKDFVIRDLKARYVGSSMGFFWSVIFPLFNLGIYMFVFRLILKTRFSDTSTPEEAAVWMLMGITVWAAFAETVSRTTNTLVENSNLIQKVVFPSEIMPSYLVISSLINMLIGLPLVLGAVAYFGYLAEPEIAFTKGELWKKERIDQRVPENQTGPYAILFATRSIGRDIEVPYFVTKRGGATPGVDFILEDGVVTIPVGKQAARIPFELIPDDLADGGEEFEIQLGDPKNASLLLDEVGNPMDNRHVVHIQDGALPMVEYPAPPGWGPKKYEGEPLKFGVPLLLLPILMFLQGLFTIGLGSFLATLNLFLRDTYHLVGVFLTAFMFATPIFYPAQRVEKAGFGFIPALNPMHWLIDCYRQIAVFGEWPDWQLFGQFAAIAVILFAVGTTFFMRQKPRFPDLL